MELRGNVPTRVERLRQGEYDAIILAVAGLVRLDLGGAITEYLSPAGLSPGRVAGNHRHLRAGR